ncbi:tRNA lysidine(34) synthetase TilS [Planctomycetota bacterium]
MVELEKTTSEFIKDKALFSSAARILLAVSGGADSMALLYAMTQLKLNGELDAELYCAHINHKLRGSDADTDERFVIEEAEKLNIPVTVTQVDVPAYAEKNKLSIETAARHLRIESLSSIARQYNCGYIATAHHKDDNAETIIQRLTRGTGFRGLTGIRPKRNLGQGIFFTSPLLNLTREQILEYLKLRDIKWRRDHTNTDCKYRRNYIRHRLIPELQKNCSKPLAQTLFTLSESARGFASLLEADLEKIRDNIITFTDQTVTVLIKELLAQYQPLRVELLREAILKIGCGERDLTQDHYLRILELARNKDGGRKIELPKGFTVRREYDQLIFEHPRKTQEQITRPIELKIPGQSRFGNFLVEASIVHDKMPTERFKAGKTAFLECFDLDKLHLPLELRPRGKGQRFVPFGQSQEKKIGKFLTAQRVPERIRKKILIVADTQRIIWVWPIRISEQARITEKTKKMLCLQITDTTA